MLRLHHMTRTACVILCAFAIIGICMSSEPVLAQPSVATAERHGPEDLDGQEPDSSGSALIRFRSVGLGFAPHQTVEADMYVHPKWAIGVGVTRGGGDRDNDCIQERCWWVAGASSYAERLFFLGDRWAHFGLRAGIFAGRFYAQTYAYARRGEEILREGAIIGPSLGASLNVTAFRWGAFTLGLTGTPGIFHGEERLGWPDRFSSERPPLLSSSATQLVFTGTVSVGVRFGNLDGKNLDVLSSSNSSNTDHRYRETH